MCLTDFVLMDGCPESDGGPMVDESGMTPDPLQRPFEWTRETQPSCIVRTGGRLGPCIDEEGNSYAVDVYRGKIDKIDVKGVSIPFVDLWELGLLDVEVIKDPAHLTTIRDIRTLPRAHFMSMRPMFPEVPVLVDGNGTVTFALLHRIFRCDDGGHLTQIAGTGDPGFGGDGGPATVARLNDVHDLIWHDGSLVLTDTWNHRVRRIRPDGLIETIAGTAKFFNSCTGGTAIGADIEVPQYLAASDTSELFVGTGFGGFVIQRIDRLGQIMTVQQVYADFSIEANSQVDLPRPAGASGKRRIRDR
jgi:hypothetical protein